VWVQHYHFGGVHKAFPFSLWRIDQAINIYYHRTPINIINQHRHRHRIDITNKHWHSTDMVIPNSAHQSSSIPLWGGFVSVVGDVTMLVSEYPNRLYCIDNNMSILFCYELGHERSIHSLLSWVISDSSVICHPVRECLIHDQFKLVIICSLCMFR